MKNDKRMTYKNEYGEWCVKSTEAQNIAINTNKDKYYTGAPIDRLAELEDKIESGELKECGGESCPNFKHYQAECECCTQTMEVKKSLEIESAVQQAVKEVGEWLRRNLRKNATDVYFMNYDEYGKAVSLTVAESLVLEIIQEAERRLAELKGERFAK